MKSICFILFLGFYFAATPQGSTQYATAPNLNIIKSKLISIVRVDVTRSSPPPLIDGPLTPYEVIPPKYEWQGKVELEVQNSASKSIKSIDWEFFLTGEMNSEKIARNYRIYSKKTIRPGQIANVTGWIKDPYLKELRKHVSGGLLQGRAEIKRVNYADGGIWLPLKVAPTRSQK